MSAVIKRRERYSYASLCTILLAFMYESQRDRKTDYRFLMLLFVLRDRSGGVVFRKIVVGG